MYLLSLLIDLINHFNAQVTFLIIINVKNNCAAQYFYGNSDTFFSDFFE